MLQDSKFISQEVTRFQTLLSTSGRQYGGDKLEALRDHDIWNEDHTNSNSKSHNSSNSNSGGGNSGGTTLSFVAKKSPSSSQKSQSTYKVQSDLTQFFNKKKR